MRHLVVPMLLLAACGASDSVTDGARLGGGVGPSGSQDFGLFKKILEGGGIPGPDAIDDVGFFAEHFLAMPPPACGEAVCLHGLVGTMGNMISGTDCTTLLLGMNTPLDPATMPRPPLNLAIAIDTSAAMGGADLAAVREGLFGMLGVLEPQDRVSLVAFSSAAQLLVEHAAGDDPDLVVAVAALQAGGSSHLYDGLRVAYETVERWAEPGAQNRVLLVSNGIANAGITSTDRILSLSAGYNERGFGLTTIGLGSTFNVHLMRSLAEIGGGAFYFLEDGDAVGEVFQEEAAAFLLPLAQQIELDVQVSGPWSLRAIYGTSRGTIVDDTARIDIPSLQLAHRTSASDADLGRRGGGGGILIELLPHHADAAGDVGTLDLRYVVPGTDEVVAQRVELTGPQRPGEDWFASPTVEKGFVMLNLLVGFQMAAEAATIGNGGEAARVLTALEGAVEGWLMDNPDADIEDDLRYVRMFITNVRARFGDVQQPEWVPDPWPAD